jgi:hypothetical protein
MYKDLIILINIKDNIGKIIKLSHNCIHLCDVQFLSLRLFCFFLKGTVSRDFRPSGFFHQTIPLTPRNPKFSNDYLDFLGKYEAICETAIALESGP